MYAQRSLAHAEVDAVMSRGVELPDLFDALPHADAVRESAAEIAAMREACLRLLGGQRLVA